MTVPIVLLLVVLYLSYRQTIVAYPTNGGAYTVAKENLGRNAGLLAAAAPMIDYVLKVAVGISAGVGALTSSIPALAPYTLVLCLGTLLPVTVANLRGTAEAGLLFALPTYMFMASFLGLIGVGLWRVAASGDHPHAIVAPPPLGHAREMVGLWLLMRAFAAGCTAMTGVEVVSNGVGSCREPVVFQLGETAPPTVSRCSPSSSGSMSIRRGARWRSLSPSSCSGTSGSAPSTSAAPTISAPRCSSMATIGSTSSSRRGGGESGLVAEVGAP